MDIGKIPADMLEKLIIGPINKNRHKRADVLIRPKTGEDCAAIEFKNELCIVSTDPITGADRNAGYLAVHINCNDVASSGGEPVGILLTLLLPPESTEEELAEIVAGAYEAAAETGIEIIGGHSEVTAAVNKPVVSAAIIGKTTGRSFISSGGAVPGQSVIMTKWAGLEGTAIIAADYEDRLAESIPEEKIKAAKEMKGFLSVLPEAKIAVKCGATAMHDVTEGGILGAVWEVSECSGTGVEIYLDKIPVKDVTKEICACAGIDPYRLISSGSMIMTAADGDKVVSELINAGIEASVIGRVTENTGRFIVDGSARIQLEEPGKDELYNAFKNV